MAPRLAALLALAAALLLPAASTRAQGTSNNALKSKQLVVQADKLTYDNVHGIVTAIGHVEIATKGQVLLADRVSFNQVANTVTASGHVVLVEPSGETIFSHYVELSGDLKQGVMRGIGILMADNARFAANGARRSAGRYTVMAKAVYSPCPLCPTNPNAAPLWQLKARRIVHDEKTHNIIFHDATFEVFGVPIFYTPYLSQPDPTVKRRSGFLAPSFGSVSTLGYTAQVPYFYNIAPNKDATIAPIFTTKQGIVLAGQYRERTHTGLFEINPTLTRSKPLNSDGEPSASDRLRWSIKSDGLWQPDPVWQYGYNLYRSSDKSYLSSYNLDSSNTLTSDAFVEGFHGRSYASAFGYAFQNVNFGNDTVQTPLILPVIDYQLVGEPDRHGAFFTVDSNLLSLTGADGTDSRRFIIKGTWRRPFVTAGGDLFTWTTSLRGDAYVVNNVDVGNGQPNASGMVGRILPLTALKWSWPLVRQSANTQQLIEPIVMAVASPNGGNPSLIPNEDSQEFEFNDTNLFSTNRFPGYDRVEGGLRVNYGLKLGVYGRGTGRSELLFGQVWREHVDSTFGPQTGLDSHFSDYVGRALVSPASYLNLSYRFRIDHHDFTVRRSELTLGLGPDWLHLDSSYVRLKDQPDNVVDTTSTREQVAFNGIAKFLDNWSLTGNLRQDLTGGGTIRYGAGLAYQNQCIEVTFSAQKRFTSEVYANPGTIFLFTIRLKTLGS